MILLTAPATAALAQTDFVTFGSGHVRPLALSANASTLFALDIGDRRLEWVAPTGNGFNQIDSAPVGVQPVSLVARSHSEASAVNDLISISLASPLRQRWMRAY
jgi:hypothetical protein